MAAQIVNASLSYRGLECGIYLAHRRFPSVLSRSEVTEKVYQSVIDGVGKSLSSQPVSSDPIFLPSCRGG